MNVAAFLLENGAELDSACLLTTAATFNQRDLRQGAGTVARVLESHSPERGSRFLLMDQSSFFWVSAYLGTIACGCVSVPLPVTIEAGQFSSVLRMTDASGIFIGTRALKRCVQLIPSDMTIFTDGIVDVGRQTVVVDLDRRSGETASKLETHAVDERRDLAAIMFTSGSTATPRGVMVSHRNIIANTESIIEYMKLTAEDRVMAFLPFHYCFGTSLLHTHLRVGGSLVVENNFIFPNQILKRMIETDCTGVAGVPSHFQILLRNSALNKTVFPHLRWVQQAGGKLHDLFLKELREALPQAKIYTMYGQTEATARLSFLPPELLDRKLGSIGKGIPGVQLKVLNDQGQRVAPGEVGEVVAWGDNIALGYWRDPQATAEHFRLGALFTGDLATVDGDGYVYIVDRAKDFIKCGGSRVSCRGIEDVLLRFPGMVEVAVVPVFDESLGEAVCLCAVHQEGEAVREELNRYCGQNLPWDQMPRAIHFLNALPKNSSGKVDKPLLRERFGQHAPVRCADAANMSHGEAGG